MVAIDLVVATYPPIMSVVYLEKRAVPQMGTGGGVLITNCKTTQQYRRRCVSAGLRADARSGAWQWRATQHS